MLAVHLAAQNIDFRVALERAGRAQYTIDCLEAIAADGEVLDQAQRDALATAIATVDRERGLALDLAERHDVDFVEFPGEHCVLCYTHEAGRWEGFVSLAPAFRKTVQAG